MGRFEDLLGHISGVSVLTDIEKVLADKLKLSLK
jgi:hypothetical protein